MFNSFSCFFLKGALGKDTNQPQAADVESGRCLELVKATNEPQPANVEGEGAGGRLCEHVAEPAPNFRSKAREIGSSTCAHQSDVDDEDVKEVDVPKCRADSSTADDAETVLQRNNGSFVIGTRFTSFAVAKEAAVRFAGCPLVQRSMRGHKYLVFRCFRAAKCEKKESKVDPSQQRNKLTRKCDCPFEVKLKKIDEESFVVYMVNGVHNHPTFSEDELASLPQNRYIPDDVKEKMLELRSNGTLSTKQIILLIEQTFFPELPVTWTSRDVFNLFRSINRRSEEATELINHLQKLQSDQGWKIALHAAGCNRILVLVNTK